MTLEPAAASMLIPSLCRPPGLAPKPEMILPRTGQRKGPLDRGAGSGTAVAVCGAGSGVVVAVGGGDGLAMPGGFSGGAGTGRAAGGGGGAIACDAVEGLAPSNAVVGSTSVGVDDFALGGGNCSTAREPVGAIGVAGPGGSDSARAGPFASTRPGSVRCCPGFTAYGAAR